MLKTKLESIEKDYVHILYKNVTFLFYMKPHWVSCSFAKEKLYMQDLHDARYNHTMKKKT